MKRLRVIPNRFYKNFLAKRKTQVSLDLFVLSCSFWLAYLLRFDFELPPSTRQQAWLQLPWVVLCQVAALLLSGVHTFIWRYVGMAELRAFFRAALWSALPLLGFRLLLPDGFQQWRVPLSVIAMDTILAFSGVLGLRVARRGLYERFEKARRSGDKAGTPRKRVLLVGAGRAGILAAREIQGRGDMDLEVMGFLDDDPQKHGSSIHGVNVLGATEDLPRFARKLALDHVVITIAQASRQEMRRIIETCESIPIKTRIIPGLYDILEGKVEVSRLRNVQIEDLLGREPVQLDEGQVRAFLAGKRVMVTGAGGSIGSELACQVARFHPSNLLLVERAEGALFEIDRKVRAMPSPPPLEPLVADVGDEGRMRMIFEAFQPQVVFHAAAHKHVPLMEQNPSEAIKNNVLATHLLGMLAAEAKVEAFVFISTDKAVRPSSIMGASKRVAELVIQELNRTTATRFVAVRFGNVIGSAGSVIPIFREQIRSGGPVTVTHPEMVRYFMTIPEASQLVLQAGAMGKGGEIFILDMGEPVRIYDMALDMIRLSGLKPFEDIDVTFTGVRPGEKLFEELQTEGEQVLKTHHPKILIGRIAGPEEGVVSKSLDVLSQHAQAGDAAGIRRALSELLPESMLAPGAAGSRA